MGKHLGGKHFGGKLFVVATVAVFAFAAAAQAMPQPQPLAPQSAQPSAQQPAAQVVPVKVEEVTGAAHLIFRNADHAPLLEGSLVMVGQVPAFADDGCRMRDTAQDAAPSAPHEPTTTAPRAPRPNEASGARPKGHWTVCS